MPRFHEIERPVGRVHQRLDGITVPRINGKACAQRDGRLLVTLGNALADARQDLLRAPIRGLRQNQRELIATMTCTRVDRARVKTEHIRRATQGASSDLMTEFVNPANPSKAPYIKEESSVSGTLLYLYSIGPCFMFSKPVSAMNLGDLSERVGVQFDGLLGQDSLRQFRSARINYHSYVVELEQQM